MPVSLGCSAFTASNGPAHQEHNKGEIPLNWLPYQCHPWNSTSCSTVSPLTLNGLNLLLRMHQNNEGTKFFNHHHHHHWWGAVAMETVWYLAATHAVVRVWLLSYCL